VKENIQTLEFPVSIGQAERVAYEVLAAEVGRRRCAAAFMAAKGLTNAQIAAKLGLHPTRPSQVLGMDAISPRLHKEFAETLGFPVCILPAVKSNSKAA
jgi:hypothetical protein